MPKLDVFALIRPERPTERRQFGEPPGQFSLRLRPPDTADKAIAAETARTLCEDYLWGNKELGRPAAPFPDPEVRPSESLFKTAALVAEMQAPEDERERYSAVELVMLASKLPGPWGQVERWVSELLAYWDAVPNGRGASTG